MTEDYLQGYADAMNYAIENRSEPLPAKQKPEQDCVGWFGYDTSLRLWFEANKGDDGAIPLYKDSPKTDEVLKKDAALRQARHMLGKWDGGFSFDDFEADVTFLMRDIAEALGETHD
jgi:hypothetical protein